MGPDGKVAGVRWTQCRDPQVRDAPEGIIDPMLKTIGFYQGERALALLHYYAVHPTSEDGTGLVTPEFVGLARNRRREESGVPHLYFTGCAGNVTAGKYNDGIADNRELFTERIHRAMLAAEQGSARQPLERVRWTVEPVRLPPREDLDERKPAGANRLGGYRGQSTQQSRSHADVSAPPRPAHSHHLSAPQRPGGSGPFAG